MKVEFIRRLDEKGLQWTYTTDDGKYRLSIICDKYSYGGNKGEFEAMCSWLKDVQGHLSFKQVAQKIDTIYRLEKNDN